MVSDPVNLASADLNLLVAFDALMTERSVTRAGQRIGLGQPGMSAALARLRATFGDELFVRIPGKLMRPTTRAIARHSPIAEILAGVSRVFDAGGPSTLQLHGQTSASRPATRLERSWRPAFWGCSVRRLPGSIFDLWCSTNATRLIG